MPKRFHLSAVLLVCLVSGQAVAAQPPVVYTMTVNIPDTGTDADVFSTHIIKTVGGAGPGANNIRHRDD
jgi:hypothetical protein